MPDGPAAGLKRPLKAGSRRAGGPTVPRAGRDACIECGSCVGFSCPSNGKNGTWNTVLPRAIATGNVQLVAHAMVRQIDTDDAGKVTGTDRIAVMTALNFAHELLRERRAAAAASAGAIDGDSARRRIQAMQTAIDQALAGQEKLF